MTIMPQWKIRRLTKKIKSMKAHRVNNQPNDQQVQQEIKCYFDLADIFKSLIGKKKYPYAELMLKECYKGASTMNDSNAHFVLGQMLLEEAKFREKLNNEGVFNSDSNKQRYVQLYEESQAHLLAADRLGSIQAKRLRGLCLINGWGIDANKDAGFELVVASIEQEGSWDKVPQIFASIGLNKPEFFTAIMQRKK